MEKPENIRENVPVSDFTTMRVGGNARYLVEIETQDSLINAVKWAKSNNLSWVVLGSGSNTLFTDEGYSGLVIVNRLKGMESDEETDEYITIRAASGEIWDDFVEFTVDMDLTGIEALSLIPGTVGAAPVQNIGAYGQELSDTFVELQAYDSYDEKMVTFSKEDCGFGYRSSYFKIGSPKYQPGRYIITAVSLKLTHGQMSPPFYTTLQKYLDEHEITDYSPSSIREAVIDWRSSYLPDPTEVANSGSFFANPIISAKQLEEIVLNHPTINEWGNQWNWQQPDGSYKVAAGRLAEAIGLKDWHDSETGMGTWKNSALILVNENGANYQALKHFKEKYISKMREAYGIELRQEPDLIES